MKCKVIILTLWFCKVVNFLTDDTTTYNHQQKEIPYSKCVAKMPMNKLSNWFMASVRLKCHGTARSHDGNVTMRKPVCELDACS